MSILHRLSWIVIGAVGCVVFIFLILWVPVLVSSDPLAVPWAAVVPLPMACWSHGCVTTTQWQQYEHMAQTFARTAHQSAPSTAQGLTTLIRQRLVASLVPANVVSDSAVRAYRENVLHLTSNLMVERATGLSLYDYDQLVLKPLLEQEALRQLRKAESLDELYVQVSQEQRVFVLPVGLFWDTEKAVVQQQS